MTEPDDIDIDFDGCNLKEIRKSADKNGEKLGYDGSLDMVKANMNRTRYPENLMHFVDGDVLKTIPETLPEKIALLRLDTDFFHSTLHELRQLYPLVVSNGVIYIDDYGWCEGARLATDQYLETLEFRPFLVRIDECVRVIIKR